MKDRIILILIIIVSAFLRLYQLDKIPGSLHQDEVAQGYNAYSILKTGKDEHGKSFPLLLQSFGDEKMALQTYSMIPFIFLFGLSETAIRLPSAFSGIIGTFLIYLIAKKLFNNKNIALIASFLYAFSSWNIYFSRAAYEMNLGVVVFLAGLFFFLDGLNGAKNKARSLLISTFFFSLTLFIYHSHLIFTSLMFYALFLINRKKLVKVRTFYWSITLMTVCLCFSFYLANIVGGKKVSTLLIFNNPKIIYRRVETFRSDKAIGENQLSRIVHNKFIGLSYQFLENYVSAFSPGFLFDSGGEKVQHNLGYFGNFHLLDAFLLAIGFLAIFWRREKFFRLIIFWFIFAPIPASLTIEPQNSTRLYLILPAFILVCSYGLYFLIDFCRQKFPHLKTFFLIGILGLYLGNVILFLDGYFVHFNYQRVRFWNYGFKQAVELAQKYPDYQIVMNNPQNFSYVYFLFYTQYDPAKFRKEVVYYPTTEEGFMYVKNFGRFGFPKKINYKKLEPKTIYFDSLDNMKTNTTINLPSGEPFLGYLINN